MNDLELRSKVVGLIRGIAPQVVEGELRPDRPLRDQVDLDSMDWLNVIVAVHRELHVDIPETDYARLASLDDWVRYLRSRGVA